MIQIDIEMPEKCGLCPLFHAEHPMHCQGIKADRKKKIVAPYGQLRPDWCPLHEVIDIHTGYVGVDDDYPVSVKQVLNITAELGALETQSRVRELPRYQVTDTDTVSRQATVEICFNGWNKNYREIAQDIKDLPSAQPEIIRCKECKHFHYDMPYVIQGVPVLGHEVCDFWGDGCKTSENGFCSYAERRTDE